MRRIVPLALAALAFTLGANRASAAPVLVDFEDPGVAVGPGTNLIVGDITSRGFLFDSLLNHTHRANNVFSLNNGGTWMGNDDFPPAWGSEPDHDDPGRRRRL